MFFLQRDVWTATYQKGFNAQANSEGSGRPVYPHSPARAIALHKFNKQFQRKIQTKKKKTEKAGPSKWPLMRIPVTERSYLKHPFYMTPLNLVSRATQCSAHAMFLKFYRLCMHIHAMH